MDKLTFLLAKFDSDDICQEEPSPKTFGELDALMNKILINLEETEYVFKNQAKEILDRDLTLHTWRSKLKKLKECVEEKKQGHERIDHSIQLVFRLGVQISNILAGIEKELAESSLLTNGRRFTPRRMSLYDTMLNLNAEEKEMFQQISDTVSAINDLIEYNPSDPIEQFTKILSLHMETLKMIETKLIELEEELRRVKSLYEFYRNLKTPAVYEYYY